MMQSSPADLFAATARLNLSRLGLPAGLIETLQPEDMSNPPRTASFGDAEFFTSASAMPCARYRGALVHSQRDPLREAAKAVSACLEQQPEQVLLLGFGLGYHAQLLAAADDKLLITVLEPDAQRFTALLAGRSLEALPAPERIRFIVGASLEETLAHINDLGDKEWTVLRLGACTREPADYWHGLEDFFSRVKSRKQVNTNTLRRFGRQWVRNLLHNCAFLPKARPLAALEGAFAGLPALLVAAGPSLDEVLPHLPELAKRMVVIAVDTSWACCQRAGVEPDFGVVVDPQYWNTRHLDQVQPGSARLVSESSTHPRAFYRLAASPLYLAESLFPLGTWLEQGLAIRGKLGMGGSVATSAWDLARLLGCNPICCAGLDLGFPQGNTHFKGSFFENRMLLSTSRLSPFELALHRYLHSGEPRPVPNNAGGTVQSDARLLVYLWWFEGQMKAFPELQTLNLSEYGAKIQGMNPQSIRELLSWPPLRQTIAGILDRLDRESDTKPSTIRMDKRLALLDQKLAHFGALAEEGQAQLDALRREFNDTGTADLARLDEIDGRIAGFPEREIAGFLLQDVLDSIKNQSREPGLASALASAELLYQGILQAVALHRELLRPIISNS